MRLGESTPGRLRTASGNAGLLETDPTSRRRGEGAILTFPAGERRPCVVCSGNRRGERPTLETSPQGALFGARAAIQYGTGPEQCDPQPCGDPRVPLLNQSHTVGLWARAAKALENGASETCGGEGVAHTKDDLPSSTAMLGKVQTPTGGNIRRSAPLLSFSLPFGRGTPLSRPARQSASLRRVADAARARSVAPREDRHA